MMLYIPFAVIVFISMLPIKSFYVVGSRFRAALLGSVIAMPTRRHYLRICLILALITIDSPEITGILRPLIADEFPDLCLDTVVGNLIPATAKPAALIFVELNRVDISVVVHVDDGRAVTIYFSRHNGIFGREMDVAKLKANRFSDIGVDLIPALPRQR